MTPAFGYVRCSGLGQMYGDGPVRQRQTIETFCAAHDLEIVEWFIESYTGTDLDNRPELQRLRLSLASNGVRVVVIEKLDRAARDVMIQEAMIADFQRLKVELKSATPGEEDLCSDSPTRVLIRQILGAFFGYERKMIVSKLQAARERQRIKEGRCEGRKPFGHFPAEQRVLARMIELSKEWPTKAVTHILNKEGLLPRSGRPWNYRVVCKILKRQRRAA